MSGSWTWLETWQTIAILVLAHFLWQGILISGGAHFVAYGMRIRSARWRCRILSLAVVITACAPLVTLLLLTTQAPRRQSIATDQSSRSSAIQPPESNSPAAFPSSNLPANLEASRPNLPAVRDTLASSKPSNPIGPDWKQLAVTAVLFVYATGVTLLLLRLFIGVRRTLLIKQAAFEITHTALLKQTTAAARLAGFNRLPNIKLSHSINVPAVIGLLQATVVLPAALIAQLPADQLQSIVLHELIHIRRFDPWMSLLQRLVEAFLFFHPAVWWLSLALRRERELACDEAVLALGTAQEVYAAGLLSTALFSRSQTGIKLPPVDLDLTATNTSMSQLRTRLHHILGEPIEMRSRITPQNGTAVFLAIGVLLLSPWLLRFTTQARPTTPSLIPLVAHQEEQSWGETNNGLQVRITPVKPDSDEQNPAEAEALQSGRFEEAKNVTFLVEIKNVSKEPVELCNVRYNDHWSGDAPGTSSSNHYAPVFFDVAVTDKEGRPVVQPQVEFANSIQLMLSSGVQVVELKPEETTQMIVTPGQWQHYHQANFGPGEYKLQLIYHGVADGVKEEIKDPWKDKPFAKAWSGKAASNAVSITVAKDANAGLPDIAWGEETKGLTAGLRLVADDGKLVQGSQPTVQLLLKNVSEDTITFWSETFRQDDQAELVLADGKRQPISGTWYSGWPVMIKWTLKSGEVAQLSAPNLGIAADEEGAKEFSHPIGRRLVVEKGKYGLQYKLNIGGIQGEDADGNKLYPGDDDWAGFINTGIFRFEVE